MRYYQEGLDEIINNLGMQAEINKFFEAGLSYNRLAKIFYKIFDPSYLHNQLGFNRLMSKGPSDSKRNFNIIMQRYGVGCNDKKSYKRLGETFNLSIERIRQIIDNFERKMFPEREFLEFLKSWQGPDENGFYMDDYCELVKLEDFKGKLTKTKIKNMKEYLIMYKHMISNEEYNKIFKRQLRIMRMANRKYKPKIKEEIYYLCLEEICRS